MIKQEYLEQVRLLTSILPFIAEEKCFALKGGTAINLFYQNLPRLSVDIDLAYIYFDTRDEAYKNINNALERINSRLNKTGYKAFIRGSLEKKILCSNEKAAIKIEPNYTIRGMIEPPNTLSVCSRAEELFGYTECNVLSKTETYGGKICAALDRQHPRDLFDIYQLFEQKQFNDDIIKGFIVMLLSSPRPIYEILNPNILNQEKIFASEFQGMTDVDFTYKQHIETLKNLIDTVQSKIKSNNRDFLLDFAALTADLKETRIANIDKLPAIKWKVQNLEKLKSINPDKFKKEYQEIKKILD